MRRQPFIVGDWEVFPLEGRIVRDGRSERLRPKAMDVLCLLAASPGDVVERDTILGEVWGRTAVTDEPLTATIGELRRVLGDSRSNGRGNGRGNYRYVETIPKRGYRLVAEVSESASQQVAQADASAPEPVAAGRRRGGRTWMLAAGVLLVLGTAALTLLRYGGDDASAAPGSRSEEHTSELQSLRRISYAVFCLKKKKRNKRKKELAHAKTTKNKQQ